MNGGNQKAMKSNKADLISKGKTTQFGPNWSGKRCLAKTRHGTACQKPAIRGRNRCQLHGGRSPVTKPKKTSERNFQKEVRAIEVWARAAGYCLDI